MATKLIDHIQSAQIVKLEEDVNILKNALNLMIGDINILAPKLTPIISNLNAVASSIDNNYIPLYVSVLGSQDSGNHTDGTYTNVSLGGGSGTGAKATVTIGVTPRSSAGGGIQSVTITTAGTNYLVGNTLSIPKEAIGGWGLDGAVTVIGDGTSVDGLLKRLTEFDDDYGTHISRKMPPVVDIKGMPHVGFMSAGSVNNLGSFSNATDHTVGTYYNVPVGGGSGTGLKVTVVIISSEGASAIHSFTPTTGGNGYLVFDNLTIPNSVIGGASNATCQVPPFGIDNNTPVKHAHPEGWTASTGTCLTATASINPNYTYNWTPGAISNIKFVPLSSDFPYPPTNQTWEGVRLWDEMPTGHVTITGTTFIGTCNIWHATTTITMPDTAGLAVGQEVYGLEGDDGHWAFGQFIQPYIASISSGISIELTRANAAASGSYHTGVLHFNPIITNIDFRLDIFAGNNPLNANCSYGFGKSVDDELMSNFGAEQNGVWQAAFFATVTSVGTQLKDLPQDNATQGFIGRTPHDPLSTVYGNPSPGQGGPEEEADWGEGGSHHIMDPSNQLDDEEYITTVLNTTVVPSYLTQEQILFMSDEDKIKRATQLIRMTRNKLRDDSIWQTEDVSDGVLTADDFIT